MARRLVVILAVSSLLVACDSSSTSSGTPDTAAVDTSPADTSPADVGATDTSSEDEWVPEEYPPETEYLYRACLRLASCGYVSDGWACYSRAMEHKSAIELGAGSRFALGLEEVEDPLPFLVEDQAVCINTAFGDCAAMWGCFAGTYTGDCASGKKTVGCIDEVVGVCVEKPGGDMVPVGVDCADFGLECIATPPGTADFDSLCGSKACGVGSSSCFQTTAERCIDGVMVPFDCDTILATCNPDAVEAGNGIPCSGSGGTCDAATDGPTCQGTARLTCVGGGWGTILCDDVFNLSCASGTLAAGGSIARCWPEEAECGPEVAPVCQGDVVVACVEGQLIEADCVAMGFSGCSETSDGVACQ